MKLVIIGTLLCIGFVILALQVILNNIPLIRWDSYAFAIINNPHNTSINEIMVGLSKYGREGVWIVATALLFVFGRRDGRRTAALLTIAFLILIPTGYALKEIVNRPRPMPSSYENLLIKEENDSSFPSGHALIVSAGATIVLARFNRGIQIIPSLILVAEALLVIYSRVYVGNHYPLDVIGGTLLGIGVSFFVISSDRFIEPLCARIDSVLRLR